MIFLLALKSSNETIVPCQETVVSLFKLGDASLQVCHLKTVGIHLTLGTSTLARCVFTHD